MPSTSFRFSTLAAALSCAVSSLAVAQQTPVPGKPAEPATPTENNAETASGEQIETLETVVVTASADASAEGLSPSYAGGQVAQGGRAGILGTRDHLETAFSITSYTNELIQERQARSVGDVLQNDPTVRTARGFGNFQESYFIRGLILSSDDVSYNGLYSLLPRQYIATELFERVEVLRGASAFLTGANPGGGGLGGAINLLPKRAPNEPLTRLTVGAGNGLFGSTAVDVARRFGPDQSVGLRLNAAYRDCGTAVDDESAKLGLVSLGADWRGESARLSADIGWQDNQLDETRTNVSVNGLTRVPDAPDSKRNFAQPWAYSDERDLFGTLRGEYDFTRNLTAWIAYGLRRSEEANSLANLDVSNAETGAGSTYRFDNTREDRVDTGEIGLRGKLQTGPIGHEWVIAASTFELEKDNAYALDPFNTLATNLFSPVSYAQPDFGPGSFTGNELSDPKLTGRTRLTSVAVGDTLALIDDRVLITLGARHQKLEIESFAYGSGERSGDYDEDRISPVVGAVYRLTPRLSLYANYVEGLTQGETAPVNDPTSDPEDPTRLDNGGDVLKPYVTQQFEFGTKFENGRVGLGMALFSTEKPRSLIVDNRFTTEGEDRHQGVELTLYGTATRSVRLLGGMTYLDAEQRSTQTASSEGKRVIGVPRFQASIGSEWDVTGLPGLAFDARVIHTGSTYADNTNTLEVEQWTRLDFGSRYLTEVKGKLVTLRARVDNVFDRSYWGSVGGFPDAGYLVAGGPRALVVSTSVDF